MSNHSGGSMLNQVLYFLEKEGYFENKRPIEIAKLFSEFTDIGACYDCNDSEILDEIASRYNICWNCLLPVTNMIEGEEICSCCQSEFQDEEYLPIKDIEVKDEDISIEEKRSDNWYRGSDYVITHIPTGYKTRKRSRKNECIKEIKRYIIGEIIN